MRGITTQPGRYPELDGVRGIAILLTILCNTLITHETGLGGAIWRGGAHAGWVGVQVFFVLSGFLITEILVRSVSGPYFLRNFYARRALRILPAYFLLLIIVTLLLSRHGQNLPIHPLCYWLFVSNICIANAGHWVDGMVGPTWSLAVEEHFYLIWPLVIVAAPQRSLLRVAGAVVGASLLLRYAMTWYGDSLSVYILTPTRIDGLAAGAMIALAVQGTSDPRRLQSMARWLLGTGTATMALVVAMTGTFRYDHPLVQTLGYTALTAAASGLILGLVVSENPNQLLRRLTRFGPLVSIGFYSYAMYLFHGVAMKLILTFYTPYRGMDVAGGFSLLDQAIISMAVTVLTFIVAVAIYHGIERHFLALRRYVSRAPTAVGATAS